MLFYQTNAPTGWTKTTSGVNNVALRVVTGTAGSGGSNGFTNVFNTSVATSGGSVSNHTLSISQMPSHNHDITASIQMNSNNHAVRSFIGTNNSPRSTQYTGGGGAHNHGWSGSSMSILQPYLALNYIIKT